MIRYSANYNPILEYWSKIESGEEIVSEKIRKTYKKIVRDLEDKNSRWYYSAKRANHVLEFAENYCRQSKGKYAGQLVRLELWEKAMLATIFGFVDIEGFRKYKKAVLIVGKKNGKSLLASIVGVYMLLADGEGGPEVYSVATKKDQAKIVWSEAKRMVQKSPPLKKRIRTLVAELACDLNDGVFKPLASDADTLDGLNVSCVLMDEIHQWRLGRDLYNIMFDGMVNREQPLCLLTTTAGTVREDIYDEEYDEGTRLINGYEDDDPDTFRDDREIFFIYEIDKREEWTDPACWKKANPGLGTIKNLEALAEKVEKAKRNPDMVKNLLCKEFNVRETSAEVWLNFDELKNEATFDLAEMRPRYGIGGVDFSSTTDLTAAKVLFRVRDDPSIYVISMYWIPSDLVELRVQTDKIPYDAWIDRGYVRTCAGNRINQKDVKEWFVELQEKFDIYIPWIGYDAWSAAYFVEDMKDYFGKESMIPVIQGKKTLSAPMKSLAADFRSKRIIYNNNPVDKWCLANTSYEEDRNGNIQPRKTNRATRRIDGTAALLDAYVIYEAKQGDYLSMI